jgi:hypothetical protein
VSTQIDEVARGGTAALVRWPFARKLSTGTQSRIRVSKGTLAGSVEAFATADTDDMDFTNTCFTGTTFLSHVPQSRVMQKR